MTLTELQERVDAWILDHGGYWDKFQILAHLTEELGEVAADLQEMEGLRPRKSDPDLCMEVGDLLFTVAAFANVNGLDLTDCLEQVMEKYRVRDGGAGKGQDAG